MVNDVVHTALDASDKAKALLHVAVSLIIGSIVDQRELSLIKRSDDHHALQGGAGQILVIDVYDKEVAVHLIVFLAANLNLLCHIAVSNNTRNL